MSRVNGTKLVDGYIEYPLGLRNPKQFFALWRKLRRLRPRTLVYLTAPRGRFCAWRDALFFRSCGIHHLIGVPLTRDMQQVRRLDNGLYEREGARLARCIAALGDAQLNDSASFDLALSNEERAEVLTMLTGVNDGRPVLAISVGAKVDVKDWGDSNWATLLQSLRAMMPGWGLIILGSADERERCDRLLTYWGDDTVNLCGKLSVRESAAALAQSQLFIGHDSGPMHLAAAVGTPTVAIFSSRNLPGEWFPYGKNHQVLYTPMPCQACRLDVCIERQKACILSISVEAVLESVVKLAAENKPPLNLEILE